MTTGFSPDTRSRALAAVGAIGLQALLAWALITGLSVRIAPRIEAALQVFDVEPVRPPPPPQPVPVRKAARRPSEAAAPPHARATPTPVVAPLPVIVLPPPPPLVVAAPVVALGADAAAGTADRGTGTGAGGQGSGRGAGDGGDGTGAGGTPARLIRGGITGRDYPREARDAGIEGNLVTRYVIDPHGRIVRCSIVASSGSAILDAGTCRLAIQRFRYAPARDARGRAVEDTQDDDHHWRISDDAPEEGG